MTDYIRPYGSKAQAYARFRWDYAPRAIDAVWSAAQLQPRAVVADVGAGTGMLAAHFLDRGAQVMAVEPNDEMRRWSQQALGARPGFRAIPGYAHATGLEDASIDLVAVGRAIHWFDPQPSRAEFLRILKPGGWLAILATLTTDPYLQAHMPRLKSREAGYSVSRAKESLPDVPLSFYFGGEDYQDVRVPMRVTETWEQFMGRVSSMAPAPNPGDAGHAAFEARAREIFDGGAVGGLLTLEHTTSVAFKAIKPGRIRSHCP